MPIGTQPRQHRTNVAMQRIVSKEAGALLWAVDPWLHGAVKHGLEATALEVTSRC